MPSAQQLRKNDELIAAGILAVLILGIILRNWTLIDTWFPRVVVVLVLLLFYRLVVAVEHLAYET